MKTEKDPANEKWDGSPDHANKLFGERYKVDWEFQSDESPAIFVRVNLKPNQSVADAMLSARDAKEVV